MIVSFPDLSVLFVSYCNHYNTDSRICHYTDSIILVDAFLLLFLPYFQTIQPESRQADQIPLIIYPHLYTGRNPDVVQLKLKNFPAVNASIIPFVTILIRVMEIVPVTFPVLK